MQRSDDVRLAMLGFYERFSNADPDAFAEGITSEEGALVIGTDGSQWEEGHDTWAAAFRAQVEAVPGLRLKEGDLRAYEEGTMGWAADRPSIVLPDGTPLPVRLTGVLQREGDGWKVVHCHFSFGVPDDKLEELAPALFGA